jgi:hypothetical protein
MYVKVPRHVSEYVGFLLLLTNLRVDLPYTGHRPHHTMLLDPNLDFPGFSYLTAYDKHDYCTFA